MLFSVKGRAVALGLLMAATLGVATAQEPLPRGMKRVVGVRLLVESLDDEATACGVTKQAIDAAMRITLAAAGPRVLPSDADGTPTLYANINVLSRGAECVANVEVDFMRAMSDHANGGQIVSSTTWTGGRLIAGPKYAIAEEVSRTVERITKNFAAAWLIENPK